MSSVFSLARFTDPPVEDQIRLAREEIMGYVARITCRMAFVHDVIVFTIFLAVGSPLQQCSSVLKGWCRTDTCRWDISSGRCMVSGIATHPAIRDQGLLTPIQ